MKRTLAVFVTVVLAALAYAGTASAASKIFVDDNNCPGPGTGTSADPFCTISEAVAAASAGDAIIVRPGDYTESVTVDKSLNIRGAQAGTTATRDRTSAAAESTLDAATGGFSLMADNITINGFTIEGTFDTSVSSFQAGIVTSKLHSGYHIVDNVIRDNIAGLEMNSDSTNANSVVGNRFQANNESGGGSGNGIESDQGLHNTIIHGNVFFGNVNSSILLADGSPAVNDGIRVLKNHADSPVLFYNTSSSVIAKNVFSKEMGSAVFLGGNDHTVTIQGNVMMTPVFAGVRLADNPTTPNTDISIVNNTIRGAGFYGIHIGLNSLTTGLVKVNDIRGSDPEGILTESGNSAITFERNTVLHSKTTDIEDDTTGTGTSNTANTYIDNTCGSSAPSGLCT